MAKSLIPLRPEGFVSTLLQSDQSCLSWFVLSGCSRKDAFFAFGKQDLLESKSKASIDDYVKQFFSRKEVKEYIEAYRKTLDDFLNPAQTHQETSVSMEERKARARTKAMEFAMSLADNIETAADPETVLKLMDKVGLLDGDEEVEELPRRYLPITCSECAYRKFVEENCEEVPDGTELEGNKQKITSNYDD